MLFYLRLTCTILTNGHHHTQNGSVSLCSDGLMAVGYSRKSYYCYTNIELKVIIITFIQYTNTHYNNTGYSVSLSFDGRVLAVGGPGSRSGTWVFTRDTNNLTYSQMGECILGSGSTTQSPFQGKNQK